jgi:hemerythrin
MQLLEWKAEYSTGLADIDQAHRNLMKRINRLHDAVDRSGRAPNQRFFRDLYDAIERQFAHEETSMRARSDPAFARHKDDHDRLLEQIRELGEAFADSEEIDSVELSGRLDMWFARHFTTYDAARVR